VTLVQGLLHRGPAMDETGRPSSPPLRRALHAMLDTWRRFALVCPHETLVEILLDVLGERERAYENAALMGGNSARAITALSC
jgi:hypothetical protein